eukprot:COSAG06_NODE_40939_length_396_cov_9.026936_1_plen_62_part_10
MVVQPVMPFLVQAKAASASQVQVKAASASQVQVKAASASQVKAALVIVLYCQRCLPSPSCCP